MQPVEIEFLVKNNTRSGLSGVSDGIDGVDKDAAKAQRRIKDLEAQIEKLNATMAKTPEMDQTENIRQIEALKRRIAELQSAAQTTDLVPRTARQAVSTYNGLNMSIQQLARELPTLAMGPQMFFMAISNNLPIFTDELARARKEYEAITAAGGKGIPVWRQIASSVISWQTALAAVIMLSVTYGKQIGEWAGSLFKGAEALDTAKMAAEGFHATMVEGARNAQTEVVKLNLLYRAATDNARSMDERRIAVDKLQQSYPEYFRNLTEEQIMLGNASSAYKQLVADIYEYAKAQAAFKSMVSLQEAQQTLAGASALDEYLKRYKELQQARAAEDRYKRVAQSSMRIGDINSRSSMELQQAAARRRDAEKAERDAEKMVRSQIEKLPDGDKILEQIDEKFRGNITDYVDTLEAEMQRLGDIAANVQINDSPTKPKDKKDAIKDATIEQYAEAEKARYDALNGQTVALMDEGFEKERARIRLQYERTRAEYEAEEKATLELLKKLRASGASIDPDAERNTRVATEALVTSAAKLRDKQLSDVDRKEREQYDKLLEKYETYQQGRLRIAEKYDREIAALAAAPDNRRLAEAAKQKALEDFTISYAEQFPEFEAWADHITAMSIEKVSEALTEAKNRLTMLRELHPDDETAIAEAEARVLTAQRRMNALRVSGGTSDEAAETSKWTDLNEVLSDAIATFDKVGEAIGGAGGEIISAAGGIAAAALQVTNAVRAVREASDSGDKIGMASGIISGIAAAVNVLTTLFSLFKGGETSLEKNLRLAREFNDELLLMRQRAQIDADRFDTIFGSRLYENFSQNVRIAREALDGLSESQERIIRRGGEVFDPFSRGSTGLAGLNTVAKTWESVSDSIAAMQVQTRHSTWFRSAKYASLGDLLPELFSDGEIDMEALQKFVEEGGETFQHLSAENRRMLEQMVEDWQLYEEAMDSVRDYLTGIFGDLGDSMTDALVSAAENGTDAFDTMADDVGSTLRNLAKDLIASTIIGPLLEQAQKEMLDVSSDSDLTDNDRFTAWSDVLKRMLSAAADRQDDVAALWDELSKFAAENGFDIGDTEGSSQTASAGAVQTVTQEAFSRVEGLVTSIQIHAARMDDNGERTVTVLGRSLEALHEINDSCKSLPLIYALLQRMEYDGVKVR